MKAWRDGDPDRAAPDPTAAAPDPETLDELRRRGIDLDPDGRRDEHRKGLPVRGQRTRTNARTRKGPRKTVAGKKGVKDMR